MQKILIVVLLFGIAVSGCKKDQGSEPTPPLQDTLMGWKKITTGLTGFSDVWFTSKQQGMVLTFNGIFRTTDEGASWSKVANGYYENFFFLNSQYGYAQSDNFAYTTDGGVTWIERSHVLDQFSVNDLFFTTPSTGYLAALTGLYKSVDTGKTWQKLRPGLIYGICFANANNGWMFDDGKLYKTADAGATWQEAYDMQTSASIAQIVFTDAQHGKFSGGKFFAKSDDGGLTWTKKEFSQDLLDLHFLDNNIGYVTTSFEIFKTVDGGATWTRICRLARAPLYELYFIDSNNGWACGAVSTLLQWKQ